MTNLLSSLSRFILVLRHKDPFLMELKMDSCVTHKNEEKRRKFGFCKKFVVLFFIISSSSDSIRGSNPLKILQKSLGQYRAHKAYQAQDFKTAQQEYTKLLQDSPYDGQKNYNLGVTLYKEKQFEDAAQYFDRAVQHAPQNSLLQEQSLFNRANCLVQQDKLKEAIADYKKVLKINAKNEAAQKNLKIVEQMLKQPPQKKDQQKDKKDKNKQDQQDKKDQKSSDDPSQDDQSQDDQSQQEKNQTQQQNNKGKSNSKDQQGDQQNKQEEKNETKDEQAKGLQKSKEKETNAGKQQAGQQTQDKQHQSSSKNSEQQQSTDSASVGKEEQPLDDAFAQQMTSGAKDDERLDKRSAALLEKLDDHEKNIQKKLLQMNVTKQGAQQYGQKNW